MRHLRNEVRFRDGIDTILADTNRVLIEIGPGRTLTSLARMAPARPAAVTPTMRHPKEAGSDVVTSRSAAVGRAWEAGVAIDPATLYGDEQRHRVPLPTYPFEHQRYWVEPDVAGAPRADAQGGAAEAPERSTSGSRRRRGAGRSQRRSPTGPARPRS